MIGVLILLVMMATAFLGYVLPWGQMSFWAAVITNLFSAIPFFGESIVTWLWGGFGRQSDPQPVLLAALSPAIRAGGAGVPAYLGAACAGNNNPIGVEVQSGQDTVSFHPYYTMKDLYGIVVFLLLFAAFMFFAPDYLGHPINYAKADPLVTPTHIVPEWYFLPYYAILRSIPDKLLGVIAMFGSILILFALPWLDTSKVRSSPLPDLPAVLLAPGDRQHHSRHCRLQPAGRGVADHRADRHRLLLPALPGDRAAGRLPRGAVARPVPKSISEARRRGRISCRRVGALRCRS